MSNQEEQVSALLDSVDDDIRSIHIKMDISFGSRFQQKVLVESLVAMISAWRIALKRNHKANKADITMKFNQSE